MSFADLKRNTSTNFEKLNKELSKLSSNSKFEDPIADKLWKVTQDKAGNGSAIIRFLPEPDGEDMPFIRIWDHGFQGPGGWYIEKSLTTFGEDDPVSKHNTMLWNSGFESDKKIAQSQKRRLSYYSNIYVIKDPANPENEGKVFLFKYGKKIFDKLNDLMNPSFEDEKPVNPFDLWSGANFRLKIRKVEGYPNYDKSEFDTPSPLSDNDDELEKIYKSQYSLQELLDRKYFKSYSELETKLNRVLGLSTASSASKSEIKSTPAQSIKESSAESIDDSESPPFTLDDDEDLDFWKKIAEED